MTAAAKPRYQAVKDLIRERIANGELRIHDRVPSENELVETMQVSRMTANRALRELTDEGLLERVAGRGTFVADTRSQSHVLEVQNIADEIRRRGHRHASLVIRASQQRARGEVARALQVEQGEAVFHLMLVHTENEQPIQVEDRHVLAAFAPECLNQDFRVVTPSAYLTEIAPMAEAEQVVRASQPNAAIRTHLNMDVHEPCLVVLRRTWSHGRPVTFARLHHPGSRYELTGRYTPHSQSGAAQQALAELETFQP